MKATARIETSKGVVNPGDPIPSGLPADEMKIIKDAGVVIDDKPAAKDEAAASDKGKKA